MMLMWIYFLCILAPTEGSWLESLSRKPESQDKRSLAEFAYMVACFTKRFPTEYIDHGKYCGKTPPGVTGQPVDALDNCCKIHDDCYGEAVRLGICTSVGVYIHPYFIDPIKCTCVRPRSFLGKLSRDCGRRLCECDYKAAVCFRNANPPRSGR
ncbi:basic phospholipase A2-like [Dendronephthya gigantea]|uniref:basic phospholipase A2-like n=1 Tax=Dendronephthya gigantea TaxID=151771 RepID=UPI00106C98AE|nr:basic phospholipase A2-like [Dendronephthya gigantea]